MSTFFLILLGLLMGTVSGAALYQLIAVMPGWFAALPASLSAIGGKVDRGFWIPLQTSALLAMVVALVLNWGHTDRRSPLLFAFACNVIVWIATGAYFVREILWFAKFPKDAPATPELRARGRRWLSLQWIRIVLLIAGQVGILLALTG
jgi:hypothetical protein